MFVDEPGYHDDVVVVGDRVGDCLEGEGQHAQLRGGRRGGHLCVLKRKLEFTCGQQQC